MSTKREAVVANNPEIASLIEQLQDACEAFGADVFVGVRDLEYDECSKGFGYGVDVEHLLRCFDNELAGADAQRAGQCSRPAVAVVN